MHSILANIGNPFLLWNIIIKLSMREELAKQSQILDYLTWFFY